MATILLVGGDAALLEGLSQSLAALGHDTRTAPTLRDARELCGRGGTAARPLIVVADREPAIAAPGEALAIPLAPGGALVLYGTMSAGRLPLPTVLQRAVLADLRLPLERNRLIALVQHVEERARTTGRGQRQTPPEQRAM